MTREEAVSALQRVFLAYPRFREYLKQSKEPSATFELWCEMLLGCDAREIELLVEEIVQGKREPVARFEKPDALPRNLREAANDRRFEKQRRRQQEVKYHSAMKAAGQRWPEWFASVRLVISNGARVKEGTLTKEEASKQLDELERWWKATEAGELTPTPEFMR